MRRYRYRRTRHKGAPLTLQRFARPGPAPRSPSSEGIPRRGVPKNERASRSREELKTVSCAVLLELQAPPYTLDKRARETA